MATTTTATSAPPVPADDRMPVHGIDHVELYVGNAAQAAFYFVHAFGFTETAYAGLETGRRDRVSHVLEQGRIRLVLTGTLMGSDDIAAHHAHHGDGVHKIALSVPDAEAAYHHAVDHGVRHAQRETRGLPTSQPVQRALARAPAPVTAGADAFSRCGAAGTCSDRSCAATRHAATRVCGGPARRLRRLAGPQRHRLSGPVSAAGSPPRASLTGPFRGAGRPDAGSARRVRRAARAEVGGRRAPISARRSRRSSRS